MSLLIVTDYTFPTLDVEERRLAPLGITVEGFSKCDRAALLARLSAADYVITQFARLDAEAIGLMSRAQVVVRYGIGVDNVDLQAAREQRIPVCNVPDYCIDEVADHTLALILAATRRVVDNALYGRDGKWGLAPPLEAMRCLKTLVVGVIGFGRIGREVAARLAPFKCRILVHDPAVDPLEIEAEGREPAAVDALLTKSDVITLHCPSTPATRRLINGDAIAAMKPGAILVNVARGDVVCTDSLLAGLRSGRISYAALDVLDVEPPPADHPLRSLSNVILHSHIASASAEAVLKLREGAASIVALAAQGRPLPNVVNGVSQRARHEASST